MEKKRWTGPRTVLNPQPTKETSFKIKSVNDNTLKMNVGSKTINMIRDFDIRLSLGNRVEKYKKNDGIILVVAKLILPQNKIEGLFPK